MEICQQPSNNILPLEKYFYPKRSNFSTCPNKVTLYTNYYEFELKDSKSCFYQYSFDIIPQLPDDALKLKKRIFHNISKNLENYLGQTIFNGKVIYSNKRSEENIIELISFLPTEKLEYTVVIKFTNEMQKFSKDTLGIFKHYFNSVLGKMNFSVIKKNFFNPKNCKKINNYELWPGFKPIINHFSFPTNKIAINLNITTRLIRPETILSILDNFSNQIKDFEFLKSTIKNELKNKVIVTSYNMMNSYIISEIIFDQTPKNQFKLNDTTEISYLEYYLTRYGIKIKNSNQPLLLCLNKKKQEIYLIPELCLCTGLDEKVRSDFRLMSEISKFSKGTPDSKTKECINIIQNYLECSKKAEKFKDWNISVNNDPLKIQGSKLNAGNYVMGKNDANKPFMINLDQAIKFEKSLERDVQFKMKNQPNISNWIIFISKKDHQEKFGELMNLFFTAKEAYKYILDKPKVVILNDYDQNEWKLRISQYVDQAVQIALFVIPKKFKNIDLYSSLKAHVLTSKTSSVMSQFILIDTLRSKKKNFKFFYIFYLNFFCFFYN